MAVPSVVKSTWDTGVASAQASSNACCALTGLTGSSPGMNSQGHQPDRDGRRDEQA